MLDVRGFVILTIYQMMKEGSMKLHLNPMLEFWIDAERESRRTALPKAKTEALVEILREWEAEGNAMRYVGHDGGIFWKATPKCLDGLRDAELDAIKESEAW